MLLCSSLLVLTHWPILNSSLYLVDSERLVSEICHCLLSAKDDQVFRRKSKEYGIGLYHAACKLSMSWCSFQFACLCQAKTMQVLRVAWLCDALGTLMSLTDYFSWFDLKHCSSVTQEQFIKLRYINLMCPVWFDWLTNPRNTCELFHKLGYINSESSSVDTNKLHFQLQLSIFDIESLPAKEQCMTISESLTTFLWNVRKMYSLASTDVLNNLPGQINYFSFGLIISYIL